MVDQFKSSTLNYYDSPDHCLICRFIDGDRSEEIMMAVIKQLDHSLHREEIWSRELRSVLIVQEEKFYRMRNEINMN